MTKTYWVRVDAISELPPGRQKTILARKALAAFAGLGNTESLRTYDIFAPEKAYARVAGLAKHGPTPGLPDGYEPRDGSDASKSPHSLEEFCKRQPARTRRAPS